MHMFINPEELVRNSDEVALYEKRRRDVMGDVPMYRTKKSGGIRSLFKKSETPVAPTYRPRTAQFEG